LHHAGKEARLKGFEFPKAVHVDPEPFSIEHDLITPKLSLKRPQLLKYYKAKVSVMTLVCNNIFVLFRLFWNGRYHNMEL
jgi:long-chain acyl-CoA synthetase